MSWIGWTWFEKKKSKRVIAKNISLVTCINRFIIYMILKMKKENGVDFIFNDKKLFCSLFTQSGNMVSKWVIARWSSTKEFKICARVFFKGTSPLGLAAFFFLIYSLYILYCGINTIKMFFLPFLPNDLMVWFTCMLFIFICNFFYICHISCQFLLLCLSLRIPILDREQY